MNLYKIATLNQFYTTYWIKAKSEDEARKVVTEEIADPAADQHIGETILTVERKKMKHFREFLVNEGLKDNSEGSCCSYWMGERLIYEYLPDSEQSELVFKSMGTSLILGRPDTDEGTEI